MKPLTNFVELDFQLRCQINDKEIIKKNKEIVGAIHFVFETVLHSKPSNTVSSKSMSQMATTQLLTTQRSTSMCQQRCPDLWRMTRRTVSLFLTYLLWM